MKQDARSPKSLIAFGAAALLALGAATAQVAFAAAPIAASGSTGIDNTGNFHHEVQSCLSGQTQQSEATCLREARNAHAEKERGRLVAGTNFEANALARCNVHTDSVDRAACQARVRGMGDTSGSVAGGGILRQSEVAVVPQGENVRIQAQTDNPIILRPRTTELGNR